MAIPPIEVQRLGQSIWTDNISRRLITSGELERLVNEGGVLGLTSNPSIFQQAIGETADYDDEIAAHLDNGAHDLYERLAIRDIQEAAAILLPVYERTGGVDGYVSLEVSPLLAHNTDATVTEAQRLFAAVGAPNVMIKIPGTAAGIPAIEACIAQGININVTLLFGIANYEQVAEAYISGLERRHAAGEDITNIASVASFFVSRIDALVDKMLENNIRAAQGRDLDRVGANRRLLGQAGIANAKLAYQSYRRIFEGRRFAELREAGAMEQRLLWASTGTKNPAYSDTMYVDHLIGRNTVNTMPPATLNAFMDHGTVDDALVMGLNESRETMERLREVGINFGQITHQLQEDGVELFIDSFEKLIEQVSAKRSVIRTGVINRQKLALGIYREKVEQALATFERNFINGRIWGRDATVWKDHPAKMNQISGRLGWLDIQRTIDRDRLRQLQASIPDSGITHVVVLGIGGSTLAPEVFYKVFGAADGYPVLHVLDSTDPAQIDRVRDDISLESTLFIVSSKSGDTLETSAWFNYFYALSGENGNQFIAITDAGTALETLAQEHHFRDIYINPSDIGGRYNALSYFGMVPAALIGVDLERLWAYADDMTEASGDLIPAHLHPGLWLGAIMGRLAREGRDKLCIFGSAGISSFADWAEQLIAGSTGKESRGILPVAGATVGKPHDYGSDRVFVYLKLEGDPGNADMDEAVRVLREAGHPRVTLLLPDKYAIAAEFFRWEYATAVAGHMLGINPFDEPNVAEAKQNTGALLATYAEQGEMPQPAPQLRAGDVEMYLNETALAPLHELCEAHGFNSGVLTDLIAAQVVGTNAGDYFALLAYTQYTPEINEKLEYLRRRMRHLTRRAVTVGYGPRYLHSTGQLHKGGAANGVFFQLTCADGDDIDIPGAGYSFGVLKAAQAAGDMKALYDHNLRGVHIHAAGGDIHTVLDAMATALDTVEQRRK
ncbi:MAG: bifunctional transaldolase/phosoglucose isomerase [Chloroflexota bacterium]